MKLDIFGGKVFHSIEKCLLHYERILIAKTNPNPSSLKLAMWEYQFVLVRLCNGFIAAFNVFVCINVVWSDKYLGLVLLSEVSLGNCIFLNDSVRTAIFIRTRTLVPSRDMQRREKTEPEHFWYLPWVFCQASHLLCHPGADPFWVTPLEAVTLGMELQGSPVPQDLQWGHFPTRRCTTWMCLLLSLLKWSGGGPRTEQTPVFPEQQPELSWVFKAGGCWEQRTWKSEFRVIFMGTLTNLCAWDITTRSKNISKYSFALFCFGKSYSCSCCHLTWTQHMEQLRQLHSVTFSNVTAVIGQMDQWLKWKQRRNKWMTKLFQTLPDICFKWWRYFASGRCQYQVLNSSFSLWSRYKCGICF